MIQDLNNTLYLDAFDYENMNKEYLDMLKIWQKEKFTNQILPFNDHVINNSTFLIEKKKDELKSTSFQNENDFLKEIFELDIERFLYLIKDYLRIRINKIQKFIFYIIKNDLSNLLSQNEFDYAFNYYKLQKAYFTQNLYKKLNSNLNDMTSISNQIVVCPNVKEYIFIKCITKDGLVFNIKENYQNSNEGIINISLGDVICIQENLIKNYIECDSISFL